jgi:spore maturation protein CgeB
MRPSLSFAYFAHSLRSDWNNGNAHFLRGLLRELGALGHSVRVFEPAGNWSYCNLLEEARGQESIRHCEELFPDLSIVNYDDASLSDLECWRTELEDCDVVIVHEWNPPALATMLLKLRDSTKYRLIFHDTHHRASSSPEQIELYGIPQFDGVLAFGEALSDIYRERFNIKRVWTLHEAADTAIFKPATLSQSSEDVLWIGNWGEGERTREIHEFLLAPAAALPARRFRVYGVRYPADGIAALEAAGIEYGGYLPNLLAPQTYAGARLTLHIPRQQYVGAMTGIPTIRVFEALACGIPLISAPWQDVEQLFRPGDYLQVQDQFEMIAAINALLHDPARAQRQATRGLETVQARHTCRHRAQELSAICEEILR